MAPFGIRDLRRRGFVGFELLSTLGPNVVPVESGVYVVTRPFRDPDGGPTLGVDPALRVPGRLTPIRYVPVKGRTLYIGRAMSLRQRTNTLRSAFSRGNAMHDAGWILRQTKGCERVLLAWRPAEDFEALEKALRFTSKRDKAQGSDREPAPHAVLRHS
jgi:hypothetical protein